MDQVCSVTMECTLTRAPEMRYTPSGTPVCTLGVANNHEYKSGEEKKKECCFIDVVIFGKHAETCGQYLEKGQSVVLVNARIQQQRWETEDGQKRSKHVLNCQEVKFRSKPKSSSDRGGDPYEDPGDEGRFV